MVLFFSTACLAQEKSLSPEEYIIKSGDKLTISVWKHPDLNEDAKVDTDGNISFPLIGKVEAAGLTLTQLKDRITYFLEKDYIVNPLVTITTERQTFYVYIYGEVKNPGAHSLEGELTVLRAITRAGGLSDFASSVVYIKRKVDNKEKE